MRLKIPSFLLGLTVLAGSAAAVTVVLQDGLNEYAGTEDAYISSTSSTTNYGTSADLIVKNELCSS